MQTPDTVSEVVVTEFARTSSESAADRPSRYRDDTKIVVRSHTTSIDGVNRIDRR